MKKFFTNRRKAIILALIAIFCFGIASVSAYFTATDTATNVFTIGDVDIEVTEPDFDEDETPPVTPNQPVAKNPIITNTGNTDIFVFFTVSVPYANVVTANADGSKNPAADTELFSYEINDGWIELDSTTNTADKTVTYTYAYGTTNAMTRLAEDAATVALFDEVVFANIAEDLELENDQLEIIVTGYGIQADNINDGVTAPADVWAIFENA